MTTVSNPRNWISRAACREVDPSVFDVSGYGRAISSHRRIQKEAARQRVCDSCPVASLCAADAREHGDNAVLRAGIPLMLDPPREWRALDNACLDMVASGLPPATARNRWGDMIGAYLEQRGIPRPDRGAA